MKVRGLSPNHISAIVNTLNAGMVEDWMLDTFLYDSPGAERYRRWVTQYGSFRNYEGNLRLDNVRDQSNSRSVYTSFKLSVDDGYGVGARTSASGRHGPYACWHAFRDVIALGYIRYGYEHKWYTSRLGAAYEDWYDFLAKFPETGEQNIGNMFSYITMPDCCVNCGFIREMERNRREGGNVMDPAEQETLAAFLPGLVMRPSALDVEDIPNTHMSEHQRRQHEAAWNDTPWMSPEPGDDSHTFHHHDDEIQTWKEFMLEMEQERKARKMRANTMHDDGESPRACVMGATSLGSGIICRVCGDNCECVVCLDQEGGR